jgi:hypothetical protein
MHWSTLLVLSAGLAAPQSTATPLQFSSYTQAWHAAGENHKPMLVVINPAASENVSGITLEQLQADPAIAPLLPNYVVAVVDAGSEHGQEVQRRFNPQTLPFAAVIDERQDKQVYRSEAAATLAGLQPVVAQYKDGVPVQQVTLKLVPFDCPNCRRNLMNF